MRCLHINHIIHLRYTDSGSVSHMEVILIGLYMIKKKNIEYPGVSFGMYSTEFRRFSVKFQKFKMIIFWIFFSTILTLFMGFYYFLASS